MDDATDCPSEVTDVHMDMEREVNDEGLAGESAGEAFLAQ
jgi:hypothetical protein